MELRPEREDDIDVIRNLTHAAFKDMPFSNQTEAAIIEGLREENALTLSLVAVENHEILGHIAFSPVSIDEYIDWYGLAPVSVWPEHQRKGIGQVLIHQGLRDLKSLGAKGCVVLGDPLYYHRFGFVCDSGLTYSSAPAEYFQRLVFSGEIPVGEVKFHDAFDRA